MGERLMRVAWVAAATLGVALAPLTGLVISIRVPPDSAAFGIGVLATASAVWVGGALLALASMSGTHARPRRGSQPTTATPIRPGDVGIIWTTVGTDGLTAAEVMKDLEPAGGPTPTGLADVRLSARNDGYGTVFARVTLTSATLSAAGSADARSAAPEVTIAVARTAPSLGKRGYSTAHTAKDIPHVEFYPSVFNGARLEPRRAQPTSAPLRRVEHPALNSEWFVPEDQAEQAKGALTLGAIEALNSYGQNHVAVALRIRSVTVFSDGLSEHAPDPVLMAALSSAFYAATGSADARPDAQPDARPSTPPDAEEAAAIGKLRSDSAARAAQTGRGVAGLLTIGALAVAAVMIAISARAEGAGGQAGGKGSLASRGPAFEATDWVFPAALAVAMMGIGAIALRLGTDFEARKRAVASQALALARSKGWSFVQRDERIESGWMLKPFGSVARLTASPSASGAGDGGAHYGVAYLEGDRGAWPLLRVFSSRVVWAELEHALPAVDIMREGFASSVAKLVGGTDVDVESYSFNASWRVKAADAKAAHALLTPAIIDLLNTIAEQHIAFTLDGNRVVLWDDGSAKDVDLGSRLELVERFVRATPGYLREP